VAGRRVAVAGAACSSIPQQAGRQACSSNAEEVGAWQAGVHRREKAREKNGAC